MKKVRFFTAFLAMGIVFGSSFTTKKDKRSLTNLGCYGVINKTWTWPGAWRLTVIDLNCYYISDWGCDVGGTDCTVLLNLLNASIISDDGCTMTVEIPWTDMITLQQGQFVYELY